MAVVNCTKELNSDLLQPQIGGFTALLPTYSGIEAFRSGLDPVHEIV